MLYYPESGFTVLMLSQGIAPIKQNKTCDGTRIHFAVPPLSGDDVVGIKWSYKNNHNINNIFLTHSKRQIYDFLSLNHQVFKFIGYCFFFLIIIFIYFKVLF